MDVSYDASVVYGTNWVVGANSMTWSHTVGAGTNTCLVVEIGTYDTTSGDQCTGVTFNGEAMTKIAGVDGTAEGAKQYTSIWVKMSPAAGAHNVVASFSGTIDYMFAFSKSYAGVSQTVDAFATNSGSSTTPSVSVTTVADNCWVVGMTWSRASAPGASTNTTNRVTAGGINGASSDTNADQTPAGAHALNWTTNNGAWWAVAVSLAPYIAPPVASTIYLKGRTRNRAIFTGVSIG